MNETNANISEVEKTLPVNLSNLSSSQNKADHDHHPAHSLEWLEIVRVLFVAAAAGAVWFAGRPPNLYVVAAGVICTLAGGFPIFHEAYENIAQRRMTMELSMAIAIV